MDHPVFDGQQKLPADYDYQMYDRIWQRISPELVPYPELRQGHEAIRDAGAQNPPAEVSDGGESSPALLPGAELDPCCMGTQAQASAAVLAGFIDEELAESRWFRLLSRQLRQPRARKLLQRQAAEKLAAAKHLRAAYYLITGNRRINAVTAEPMQWQNACRALRSCYHQEACNGLNYQRAGDETMDLCLRNLFHQLSKQSYGRAEELLDLLSTFLC